MFARVHLKAAIVMVQAEKNKKSKAYEASR